MGRRTSSTSSRLPSIIAYLICSLVAPVGTRRSTTRSPLLWSKVVVIGGWIPYELGLQWLSLLLFFGFVVFALSIFRSCTSQPATLRLATALVVFWPSSIINAVRVHNDALASLLMLGAMYFIAKWDRDGIHRDFHLALLFCALALLTKSSGYALATTLVLFAAVRAISPGLRRESLKRCAVAIVILGSVAVGAVALRKSQRASHLLSKGVGARLRRSVRARRRRPTESFRPFRSAAVRDAHGYAPRRSRTRLLFEPAGQVQLVRGHAPWRRARRPASPDLGGGDECAALDHGGELFDRVALLERRVIAPVSGLPRRDSHHAGVPRRFPRPSSQRVPRGFSAHLSGAGAVLPRRTRRSSSGSVVPPESRPGCVRDCAAPESRWAFRWSWRPPCFLRACLEATCRRTTSPSSRRARR